MSPLAKKHISGLSVLGFILAGAVNADTGKPSGSGFSFSSTWGTTGANNAAISSDYRSDPATSPSASPLTADVPSARPGECFARIRVPATYEPVPQTITTRDGYDRLSITPPQFDTTSRAIQVRDPATKYIVHEPRYEVRTEDVLVRPAHERLEVVPATFKTVNEQITVGESRLVWKPGANLSNISREDPHTGAIYCLVEEPAETMTIQRRVLQTPERLRRVSVPAEFTTITKRVLVAPGRVEEVAIPAEYEDVATERLARPASQSAVAVAAQTMTVNRRGLRTPERFEWIPVLCDTNATRSSISAIQSALSTRGYYEGPVDGIVGPQTEQAIRTFQTDQGISHDGFISAETLTSLGLTALVSSGNTPSLSLETTSAPVSTESVRNRAQVPGPGDVRRSPSEFLYTGSGSTSDMTRTVEQLDARARTTDDRVLNWSGKR